VTVNEPPGSASPGIPTFLLRNVARYEDGVVWILDRRRYPFEVTWVECPTFEHVARAIEAMVTQSLGPGLCAGYGMVQAAREAGRSGATLGAELERAARRLIATRPTNSDIRLTVEHMRETGALVGARIGAAADAEAELLAAIERRWAEEHARYRAIGNHGANVLRDGDRVLTHCWAENGIVYTLAEAQRQGKRLEVFCTETRPYLQGARLTADAVADLGIPVTVVTDGMPAALMDRGRVTTFMTGADRVTMDGHVINKVGTLGIAIAAARYAVPYYAFYATPDVTARSRDDVPLEERSPEEVLHCLGVRTATPKASGYYPAFDATPPDLVSGIVTDRGVFGPDHLEEYFGS
jgi:methylthioribose-1-phosphate isomerase